MCVTCLARVVHSNGFEEDTNFELKKINGEYWWVMCSGIPIEDVTIFLNRKIKTSIGGVWMFKFEEGDL